MTFSFSSPPSIFTIFFFFFCLYLSIVANDFPPFRFTEFLFITRLRDSETSRIPLICGFCFFCCVLSVYILKMVCVHQWHAATRRGCVSTLCLCGSSSFNINLQQYQFYFYILFLYFLFSQRKIIFKLVIYFYFLAKGHTSVYHSTFFPFIVNVKLSVVSTWCWTRCLLCLFSHPFSP